MTTTTKKIGTSDLWEYDVVWYRPETAERVMEDLDEMKVDYTIHQLGNYVAISLASTNGKSARRR